MLCKLLCALVVATSVKNSICSSENLNLKEALVHSVQLDGDGKYVLSWSPEELRIVFEVQVATHGYVGLGFSPNGYMKGSDIVVAWIADDSTVHLSDRYAANYVAPTEDDIQDYELLGGYSNATHTVIKFSRPWITCDSAHDFPLGSDTVNVIWAYHSEKPTSDRSNIKYHHDRRGVKSLYLKSPKVQKNLDQRNVVNWDVRMPGIALPGNLTTLYWCKLFKTPKSVRKQHFIGYKPLIEDIGENSLVHHMLLYECSIPNSFHFLDKWVGEKGAQCYSRNMPLSWSSCSTPLVAWAVGSEGEIYPDHVGFPMGEEHGGATYFLLEIHYDNRRLKQGVIDNSGLRLYLTSDLREVEAGILTIGHKVDPFMMIPPGRVWATKSHCSSECTQKMIPEDGINVFSAVLHSHLLGKALTVQHIRGYEELEELVADRNYDFNYQQARLFRKSKKLLPGDHLIATCLYDATNRKRPTFGGFGTEEEMCLVFLTYYPRQNLSMCYSRPDISLLFDVFGIQDIFQIDRIMEILSSEALIQSKVDVEFENSLREILRTKDMGEEAHNDIKLNDFFRMVEILKPKKYANKTFYDVVMSRDVWRDERLVSELKHAVDDMPYEPRCLSYGRQNVEGIPKKSKIPSFISHQSESKCMPKETVDTYTFRHDSHAEFKSNSSYKKEKEELVIEANVEKSKSHEKLIDKTSTHSSFRRAEDSKSSEVGNESASSNQAKQSRNGMLSLVPTNFIYGVCVSVILLQYIKLCI